MSPYAYANDNPLRMTDPTGLQAVARVPYVASVEWLKDIGGGGGGGAGAAPLIVLGGVISYVTQHPEQSVPFMAQMANDIHQALTNPIGFAASGITQAPPLLPNMEKPVPPLTIVNADKHGGGKNAKHSSEKARQAAEKAYEDAKKAYGELYSKPNKTKEESELVEKMKKTLKHLKSKADWKGEEHSKANKR